MNYRSAYCMLISRYGADIRTVVTITTVEGGRKGDY